MLLSYRLADCSALNFFFLDGRNFNKVPLGSSEIGERTDIISAPFNMFHLPRVSRVLVPDLICARQQFCLASRIYNMRFKVAKSVFFFFLQSFKHEGGGSGK